MSRRTIVLLVSVLLACVAAFAVWRYLSSVETNVRSDITEVSVFRATEAIPEGTEGALAAESIESSTALAENVVPYTTILCTGPTNLEGSADVTICEGHPTDLQTLLNASVAAGPIPAGALIASDMFVAPAELEGATLSSDIPDTKVAVAVDPGTVGAVGGWVRPGDAVNVLATLTLPVSTADLLLADPATRDFVLQSLESSDVVTTQPPTTVVDPETGEVTEIPGSSDSASVLPSSVRVTATVLQNIDVIAYGDATRTQPGVVDGAVGEAGSVVVLEVTPDQAEILEFVRQNAQVSLVLLPKDGTYTEFASNGQTWRDVYDFFTHLQELLAASNG